MKVIIVCCDMCEALGGADHRSLNLARESCPDGWVAGPHIDLCSACITKRNNSARKTGRNLQRLAQIAEARSSGATYQEIGRRLGISRQRVQQLWKQWAGENKPTDSAK